MNIINCYITGLQIIYRIKSLFERKFYISQTGFVIETHWINTLQLAASPVLLFILYVINYTRVWIIVFTLLRLKALLIEKDKKISRALYNSEDIAEEIKLHILKKEPSFLAAIIIIFSEKRGKVME